LDVIARRRRPQNSLDFALQLCPLRYRLLFDEPSTRDSASAWGVSCSPAFAPKAE